MKVDRVRFSKTGFEIFMSPLEADVLETLWEFEKALVKDVHSVVRKKRKVAVTSVAVILDRLHKRGLVDREHGKGRGGMHYLYSMSKNRQDFARSMVEHVVENMIEKFGDTAISYFSERFGRRDA